MYESEEKVWSLDDLPAGLVNDQQALQDHLVKAVESHEMKPSRALELYCEVANIHREWLIQFATDELGYNPYFVALDEIDYEFREKTISDVFFYLDWHLGKSD